MSKTEKRALLVTTAISSSIFFVNPTLMLTALAMLGAPTSLFDLNPWYLPLPLLGLITLVVLYAVYRRLARRGRLLVWIHSLAYWFGWCLHLVKELSPFAECWIIWGPHAAAMLISGIGIYGVIRPNQSVQSDRANSSFRYALLSAEG